MPQLPQAFFVHRNTVVKDGHRCGAIRFEIGSNPHIDPISPSIPTIGDEFLESLLRRGIKLLTEVLKEAALCANIR